MNIHRIIARVYCEPWAITKAGFDTIHGTIQRHLNAALPVVSEDATRDFFGEPLPMMEIRGDMAIIPIKGTLFKHAGLLEKMCGACSYEDITRDLHEATNVVGVQTIWLNIDSPGGQCVGNQEVAGYIEELRGQGFEINAYTDSEMCSAAYNIAAACGYVVCSSSAYVGNIGAMMALLDNSERYRMEGLKTELFASGPLKGVGADGLALTGEQRAYLQGLVDTFAGMFKENVTRNRGPKGDAMNGQVIIGKNAADAGLVDEIRASLEEAIEAFS